MAEDILINYFLLHITLHERKIVKRALNNFMECSNDIKFLTSFLNSYGLYEVPKQAEFKEQILAIARDTLVTKPTELINEIRKGISILHFEIFWKELSEEKINFILHKQHATADKVINCIKTDNDLTNDQERIFYYLQTYIYSLQQDELNNFLFFVTGSYEMLDNITLTFTTINELMIRPICYTCANVLELSICYNSYQEFKRNMTLYLNSEYSYQYTQM